MDKLFFSIYLGLLSHKKSETFDQNVVIFQDFSRIAESFQQYDTLKVGVLMV